VELSHQHGDGGGCGFDGLEGQQETPHVGEKKKKIEKGEDMACRSGGWMSRNNVFGTSRGNQAMNREGVKKSQRIQG